MLIPSFTGAVQAQDGATGWNPPVNLSKSGAASQARLFARPNGRYQAFWLDKFNGLTGATFDGKVWSPPAASAILLLPANLMPEMIADSSGSVHAFWQAADGSLMHSVMGVTAKTWTTPDQAAAQATAFSLAISAKGDLFLATLRTFTPSVGTGGAKAPVAAEVPPGIYVRRWFNGAWGPAQPVVTSIYYRLMTAEQARLNLAVWDGRLALAWRDPQEGQLLFAESSDSGRVWSQPEALGESGHRPDLALPAFLPDGGALRVWRDPAVGGACPWLQQSKTADGWQPARVAFSQKTTCPDGGRILTYSAGLLWVWGEGSTRINLAAWQPEKNAWTLPAPLSFSFRDTQSGASPQSVTLSDLRLSLAGDQLGVTGTDSVSGDIWANLAESGVVNLVSAPPSPWQTPQLVAKDIAQIDGLALTIDSKGLAHTIWSQSNAASGPTTALYYARSDGQSVPRPVQMIQAGQNEMARQPALLVDGQDRLHLAYSGGQNGEIVYTRAETVQAGSASGWLAPKLVSYAQGSAWPQIGLAPDGHLYIVYVIRFNEGRGVYWLRSTDGGETWSQPARVFDGAAGGWAGVGRAALAFGPDSSVQIVFEKTSLPGEWPVQGLFYTYALPQAADLKFSPPEQVAGVGNHNPHLVMVGGWVQLVYAARAGLEGRRLDLGTAGSAWGGVERVAGWQAGTSAEPVFGLAADAQMAHLAGPLADASGLRYSAGQNVAQGGPDTAWAQPDNFYFLQTGVVTNLATAAAQLNGGRLALAWVNTAEKGMQLSLALRSIPQSTTPAAPIVIPTSVPTPRPTATALPPAPAPTRDLNGVTLSRAAPADPLALGGGLAAVLVVVGVLGYLVVKNRRG